MQSLRGKRIFNQLFGPGQRSLRKRAKAHVDHEDLSMVYLKQKKHVLHQLYQNYMLNCI